MFSGWDFNDRIKEYFSGRNCFKRRDNLANFVIYLLSGITDDKNLQVNILLLIHYGMVAFVIYNILFTKNLFVFWFCILTGLYVLYVNIICNGCYLIHAERKYLGKDWLGSWSFLKMLKMKHDGETIKKYFFILILFLFVFSAFTYKTRFIK